MYEKTSCVFLFLTLNFSRVFLQYYRVEENKVIIGEPLKKSFHKSYLNCIHSCSKDDLQLINFNIRIITKLKSNEENCYCFKKDADENDLKLDDPTWQVYSKEELWQNIPPNINDTCNRFARCNTGSSCTETSNYIGFNDLPCICFIDQTCLSFEGEIQNLALEGTASQSSLYNAGVPTRAIDGLYSLAPNSGGGATTHTNINQNPWFQVKLKSKALIFKLRIINKNNNHKIRLDPFTIFLANSTNQYIACRENIRGNIIDIPVFCTEGKMVAQYCKIQVYKYMALHIQEMEIFGFYVN